MITPTQASLSQALFEPRSVALIGATADPAKNNSRAQRLLNKVGYTGRIIPINPTRSEVMGLPAFPRVQDAPGPIDHAFIMVPSAAVPDAMAGCVAAGVKVATIFTAGFAELGADGAVLQQRVLDIARTGGVRILGPNCLGLFNVAGSVPLTVNAAMEAEPLRPGYISLVSQSGSMMGALMTRIQSRGLGFSRMVSVGNECDIGVGELAEMLVEDEQTRVLMLFIETFRDSAPLARAARRAHDLGKAVVALKLGRSETGRQLAASHTGAMLGGDELASAFFRDHGIMRADSLEGLVELPRLILGQSPPKGRRVGAITGTGGAAALVLDRLGGLGDSVVGPSKEIRDKLAPIVVLPDVPLIDLPMGGTRQQYNAVLAELCASDHCDAVLAVLGSTTRLRPGQVDENILSVERGTKPLAVFIAPQAEAGLQKLDDAGVAGFRTPEACADALHAYLTWQTPRPMPQPVLGRAADMLAAHGAGAMDEVESCAVFAELGIAGPGSQVVTDPAQLGSFDGPVAVKVLSPDILHKTDAGLVRLNVQGREAIATAVSELLARAKQAFPQARIKGVLVAPMQRGLVEVILGYRQDPEVGPVVMLGMGGVLAELKRSLSVRLAPVDEATAREMIAELPELRLIDGFRNLPRGDVTALARAVSALSMLAATDVQDAEINPLIVRAAGQGAVAVDGLVVVAATKAN
ncbi:acetate--CoA ligase family protein [Acidisphaera sp. L21]|uniref:acetate--CoA ligase family protein n=1 Tax=Acidisphaera sp. L21 TaxID=1641851 RepID=UPI00131C2854|nr:acetate--CoA ligase family protein [Acidisphaera sp. L21]